MFLGKSRVMVPARLFRRINPQKLSLYTQDLATLLFGKETLATSTLTGKGKKGEVKRQLDPEKVEALIGRDDLYYAFTLSMYCPASV